MSKELLKIAIEASLEAAVERIGDSFETWDQVREGWPHEELHLFGPRMGVGTWSTIWRVYIWGNSWL